MKLLHYFCNEYALPGMTAAVVLKDGTTFTAESGYADNENKLAMNSGSRMLAASIGKTMVAATTMSLWEEGRFDLDTPLSRYLGHYPWYSRLANHECLTIRQLLGHRSGLADHVQTKKFAIELARRWQEPGSVFSPEELLEFILDKPAKAIPTMRFAYSDSGYILIGLLIEAVTGKSYYDIVQARFLAPLGLTATSPSDRRSLPGLAAGYTSAGNPFRFPTKSITESGDLAWQPGLEWTGGGLVSTSGDLAKWGHALFSGKVLSSKALDVMLQAQIIDTAIPESRYGLGVELYCSETEGDIPGHAGWIPGYVSSLRYYNRHGITVAFQINTDIGLSGGDTHRIASIESSLLEFALTSDSRETSRSN